MKKLQTSHFEARFAKIIIALMGSNPGGAEIKEVSHEEGRKANAEQYLVVGLSSILPVLIFGKRLWKGGISL